MNKTIISRPIKFRVWSKINNSFECSVNDWSEQAVEIYTPAQDLLKYSIKEIEEDDDFTIQQFTGLLDSAGKEIYEGDIVSYKAYYPNQDDQPPVKQAIVEFKDGEFWPRPSMIECDDSYYDYKVEVLEVVGNIFENADECGMRYC